MVNGERACYSPTEVAQFTGLSKSLVYKMIRQGNIKSIRVGEKRLVIPAGELEKFTRLEQ